MDATIDSHDQGKLAKRTQLSAWLWQPWYAKLWWAAIPIWWAGMAASTRVDVLESFYRGGFAGYLNVLFFPMTALTVLGAGYVRERLDGFVGEGGGEPLSYEEAKVPIAKLHRDEFERMMERSRALGNPMDPRSGALWIGSAMNPNNPAYIDPNGRKRH